MLCPQETLAWWHWEGAGLDAVHFALALPATSSSSHRSHKQCSGSGALWPPGHHFECAAAAASVLEHCVWTSGMRCVWITAAVIRSCNKHELVHIAWLPSQPTFFSELHASTTAGDTLSVRSSSTWSLLQLSLWTLHTYAQHTPVRHASCIEAGPLLLQDPTAELLRRRCSAAASAAVCCRHTVLEALVVLPDELQGVGGHHDGALVRAPATEVVLVLVDADCEEL